MQLGKRYCWKYISQDGLLKDPDTFGPYEDDEYFMEDNYMSLEDAEQGFKDYCKAYEQMYDCKPCLRFVLITEYCVEGWRCN